MCHNFHIVAINLISALIRYSESDIENISNDNNYKNFSFTLSDKYGDHGLICIVILEKKNKEDLFINTWLMSHRVLNRNGKSHFEHNHDV